MNRHPNAATLGILYAEDFGVEVPKPQPVTKPPPPSPPPPSITQADIDAACIRAVQAAERAWSSSAEDRRTEALANFAAGLAEVRQEAAHHAEAVADGIARTVLSALAGALPHLCRAHGDAEVRALLARLAPLVAPSMRLVVRVHPDLIETIGSDLAAIDDSLVSQVELRPANLPAGDVRLSWEEGRLVRDTASICTALQEGLAALGLTGTPTHLLQPGSLELAQ
jgi:flagellar assembly protein FliH